MKDSVSIRYQRLNDYFERVLLRLQRPQQSFSTEGRLLRTTGISLEVSGCHAPLGARCQIISDHTQVEAEVVGFSEDKLYLMPMHTIHGLTPRARVIPQPGVNMAKVGFSMLGRVVDGNGNCLDDGPPLRNLEPIPLYGQGINPLHRSPIQEALDTGIRSINALLTIGRGQRIGLFAGSGVGKSVLLGMMTRHTDADVTVVGLIGERGREVNDFIQNSLGPKGRERSVVIATPADTPPLQRLRGAALATAVAEYFRGQGKHVLLLMDSLTRYAQAQREIGLSIGEPPTTKGYPPSCFSRLPHLVERAGTGRVGEGSITAFYTVLAEGDDEQDPVVDAARAILDGHIILSRDLADAGHFPAINIQSSVSRSMTDIVNERQLQDIQAFRKLYSVYQKNRDLINIGAYQAGTDGDIDRAMQMYPRLVEFLSQDMSQGISLQNSIAELHVLMSS